jgi:hypothetical protein
VPVALPPAQPLLDEARIRSRPLRDRFKDLVVARMRRGDWSRPLAWAVGPIDVVQGSGCVWVALGSGDSPFDKIPQGYDETSREVVERWWVSR